MPMAQLSMEGPTLEMLARGYRGLASPALRNWRRLAMKLKTPGSSVSIAALGGSITAGYIGDSPDGSWVDSLVAWLKERFPGVKFSVLNLARGAVDVTPASMCWYQYVPQDVDLVMVEYSVNGCPLLACNSFASPRVAAYELLLRRMIRRAPDAALLSVAAFAWAYMEPWQPNRTVSDLNSEEQDQPPDGTLPSPYYYSGETHHAELARHYGAPMASIRDSLYDLIYDNQEAQKTIGITRASILSTNSVNHPTTIGHSLYASVVAYTVQETLAGEFRELNSAPSRRLQQMRLPKPISTLAVSEADGDPFCAESQRLQDLCAIPGDWSFGTDRNHNPCPHTNCHAFSYKAQGTGQTMTLTLDTTLQDTPAGSADLDGRYLVALYALDWRAGKMGAARVRCVSGCSCRAMVLEPSVASHQVNSIMGSARVEVTAHPSCTISITTIDSSTGGDMFRLNGIAVVPFSKSRPVNQVDKLSITSFDQQANRIQVRRPL